MNAPTTHKAISGPLRVCPQNPRYFTDDSGRAIYLTGSHTWNTLSEQVEQGIFDYSSYLALLEKNRHNFFRQWCLELFRTPEGDYDFHPYLRTGAGQAFDAKPKFDLDQFNEAYFQRMRERVIQAGQRGMYVGVMFFEGWWITQFGEEGWLGHPFHPSNNVQGLPVERLQLHTLDIPWVVERQRAYVRKVVETVNDLDNVLYEIANEDGGGTVAWQYDLIREVRKWMWAAGKQHPVGMTFRFPGGTNEELFASEADWISPNSVAPDGYDYKTHPPLSTGRKVILADTDHIHSLGLGVDWVWKCFLRGLHPLLMEGWDLFEVEPPARPAMGDTLRLAEQLDLAQMDPDERICSTGFCLAHRDAKEFVVYQPASGSFTLDLPEQAAFAVQWFNAGTGQTMDGIQRWMGNEDHLLTPPWVDIEPQSGVVAYLRKL